MACNCAARLVGLRSLARRSVPLASSHPRLLHTRVASPSAPAVAGSSSTAQQPKERRTKSMSPADAEDSPFFELGLHELWEDAGKTRVRQHVNPLCSQFQVPLPPLAWEQIYDDPSKPLIVDLGCGYGRFLLLLERKKPRDFNYLGIEIRQKLVERGNKWAAALGCAGRVHYVFTNATISLAPMLSSYPGALSSVYIQFPDPHFKKRHKKRQIFQPQLLAAIRDLLPPGGTVFLQSDVEPVSVAMRDAFEQHVGGAFELSPLHAPGRVFFSHPGSSSSVQQQQQQQQQQEEEEEGEQDEGEEEEGQQQERGAEQQHATAGEAAGVTSSAAPVLQPKRQWRYRPAAADEERFESRWAAAGWLLDNPVGVPTERELSVTKLGDPVFRVLLVKRRAEE